MNKTGLCGMLAVALCVCAACKGTETLTGCGPCPNEDQMKWQEMEYYAFIHFSMNTFTGAEWGYGNVDPKTFNPSALDCNQWVDVCKKAGMKGIILTAKHHDGFCLWPTKTTNYSVKQSPWRGGQGDLLRELSEACRKQGLKFGLYLSPWDRNNAAYGTPEYIQTYRNQLREILSNYGEIFEIWFDGANGGDGYYGGANETRHIERRTYYDWPTTRKMVRELQPHAIMFSDGGPDIRWCGNESGWVGETNWSLLRRDEVWPGWPHYTQLRNGHEDGTHWVPAEVDVSTRPGWFYHANEDHKVKQLPQWLDIYYSSIGRNATLLVNFPVDQRGLIHENDAQAIWQLADAVKADFAHNLATGAKASASNTRGGKKKYAPKNVLDGDKNSFWATDDNVKTASLTLDFEKPTTFNRFLVQEYIRLGQRVKAFTVEAFADGEWQLLDKQTTIGYKRILRLPTVTATQVRFTVTDAKACPLISNIALYNAPKVLTPPDVRRDQTGRVTITPADAETEVYYTLDGSTPDKHSTKYGQAFLVSAKASFRAIAYDPATGKSSPTVSEEFDLVRKDWKIVGTKDQNAYAVLDGNPSSQWRCSAEKMPIDLVLDLGKTHRVQGFRYLPGQHNAAGIVTNYAFYVSEDGSTWKKVSEGEFSNIKNNPVWQTKTFAPTPARFIKLSALQNAQGNAEACYAEIDLITAD